MGPSPLKLGRDGRRNGNARSEDPTAATWDLQALVLAASIGAKGSDTGSPFAARSRKAHRKRGFARLAYYFVRMVVTAQRVAFCIKNEGILLANSRGCPNRLRFDGYRSAERAYSDLFAGSD